MQTGKEERLKHLEWLKYPKYYPQLHHNHFRKQCKNCQKQLLRRNEIFLFGRNAYCSVKCNIEYRAKLKMRKKFAKEHNNQEELEAKLERVRNRYLLQTSNF